MKRYLYFLSFVIVLGGLDACKKSDPVIDPPVVGSWKLDLIRTSGFVAPYTTLNKDNDPLSVFNYQDSFVIKTDKTYSENIHSGGQVDNLEGSWDFTNNQLTLKDSQGNSDTYTLDATKTPAQLLSTVTATSDSLTNPTTKKDELVKYNIQFVYNKQ